LPLEAQSVRVFSINHIKMEAYNTKAPDCLSVQEKP